MASGATSWKLYKAILVKAELADGSDDCIAALALKSEFAKLYIQVCPFCSGYGHTGNDCPTDKKLAPLRMGTSDQKALMRQVRKACR